MVGLMGWFVPQMLGVGYQHVGEVLNGRLALRLMILLLVLKFIAVTVSYASGNAGGIFGPSLFMGAMLGGAVGTVAQHLLPGYIASPGAYALVGMGAAFAGVIRAPMTSAVMIFEITRDYAVIVPLMICNLLSFFISARFQKQPIYEVLAHQDGIHLPTAEARHQEGQRPVAQAMSAAREVLDREMTVQGALEKVKRSEFRAWPVCDERGVIGVVSLPRLKQAMTEGLAHKRLTEFADTSDFPHVHEDHSLHLALDRMGANHLDLLPVVSRANVHQLEGVVTLEDVLALYGVSAKESLPTGE
jgi:CIC family chloride channel protein